MTRFSEHNCPLNGCRNKTADPRRPCDDCLALAGALIKPSGTEVPEEEFLEASAAGDAAVRRVLRDRWLTDRDRTALLALAERNRPVEEAKAEIERLMAARAGSEVPARGRGWTPRLTAEELAEEAVHLVRWCGLSNAEAARMVGVSKVRLETALRSAA